MKKFYLPLIFIISSVMSIYAQNNYVQGYIITNEQDTVRGWLDYRTDRMNNQLCKFRPNLSGKEQSFMPGKIAGFRYLESGKFYVTKTIIIDNVPRVVFLEYLIHGVMNLYFYQDENLDIIGYYIFEDENGELQTIAKYVDKYVVKDDGGTVIRKDLKYRTDLNFVFGDVESISTKLANAAFTHNTMIDFAKEYHNKMCTTGEECIKFETKVDNKNVKYKFSIYSGNEGIHYRDYYTNEKKVANALIIGGRIESIIPRWNKSISFLIDLSYAKNKGIANNYYSISKFEIDFGGKYTYHKGAIRPTVEAGISLITEKYPEHFSYVWNVFAGAGIDFKVATNNYIFILFDYVNTYKYHSDILKIKIGYKF